MDAPSPLSITAQPKSVRLRYAAFADRARRVAGKLIRRPWQSAYPAQKATIALVVTNLFISAAVAMYIGVTEGMHLTGAVLLLAVLAMIAETMIVPVNEARTVDCSDALFIVAIFVLPPGDAVLAILLCALMAFITNTTSWTVAIGASSFALTLNMAAFGAMHTVGSWVPADATWSLVVITSAGYLTSALLGELLCGIILFIRPASMLHAVSTRPTVRELLGEAARFVPSQLLLVVSMSCLGILAWQHDPWLYPLVLVPFAMTWYATRQNAALNEARKLMHIDDLTGLANRAGFAAGADVELSIAHIEQMPAALIMGDLDNFKRVNDTLGHIVGDDVLKSAAAAFTRARDNGVTIVGRYGGEEFVGMLVGYDCERAVEIAEAIRADLEETLRPHGTTISLGVAYLERGDRLESLIDRADKSLYAAKYAGKNRVYHRAPGSDIPEEADRTPSIREQMACRLPEAA